MCRIVAGLAYAAGVAAKPEVFTAMTTHADISSGIDAATAIVNGWLAAAHDSGTSPEDLVAYAEALGALQPIAQAAKCYIARRSDAPPEAFAVLATDDSAQVRTAVAKNPSTPPNVLAALAAASEPDVLSVLAANPSTPEDVLNVLAAVDDDHDYYLLWEVAGNKAATHNLIDKVLNHEFLDDELCMRLLDRDDLAEEQVSFITRLRTRMYGKSVASAKALLAVSDASPSL